MSGFRIINILIYTGILVYLYTNFFDKQLFKDMGGAEYAFVTMFATLLTWMSITAFGLCLSKLWAYKNAVWINSVVMIYPIVKVINGAPDGQIVAYFTSIIVLCALNFAYRHQVKRSYN